MKTISEIAMKFRGVRLRNGCSRTCSTVACILAMCLAIPVGAQGPGTPSASRASVSKAYGKLPLYFEKNTGQSSNEVRFLSRGAGYGLFLTPTESVLELQVREPINPSNGSKATGNPKSLLRGPKARPELTLKQSVVRMKFLGTKGATRVSGVDDLEGKSNYVLGNDPKKWVTNIPTFAKVQSSSMYPGVDVLYYGSQGRLEYDLLLDAKTDPSVVRIGIEGTKKISLSKSGDLRMETETGTLTLQKPVMYQVSVTGKKLVPGNYVLRSATEVGFQVSD